jgi:hypothetical protein
MHISPNYEVNQLRGTGDVKALQALLDKFAGMLKPYKKQ